MSFYATVLYPGGEGTTFNMDYYLTKHMPLVQEKWGPMGLVGYKIIEFMTLSDGVKPPFAVGALLEWVDKAKFEEAYPTDEGKFILADIPAFSNKQPTFLAGDVVGQNK